MKTIHYSLFACLLFEIFAVTPVSAETVSIVDHGAVADGHTLNTRAIQSAVDDCAARGGGTVLIPAGVWLSGSVALKSHVTLPFAPLIEFAMASWRLNMRQKHAN